LTVGDKFTVTGWKRVRAQVGSGHLTGKLVVNQVYAKYQHERLDLSHPRGGSAKYLEGPLYTNYADYYRRLAKQVLDGDLTQAMIDVVESLNTAMSSAAPIEANNLRRSGSPRVFDNGAEVYHRPAWQRRLSEQELRAQRRSRRRR